MIVVDSTVWIDYFNGVDCWQTERLDTLLNSDVVLLGDLVLAEVLQGFRADRDFASARAALEVLPLANMVGPDIAVASAQNYRKLRKIGVTVRRRLTSSSRRSVSRTIMSYCTTIATFSRSSNTACYINFRRTRHDVGYAIHSTLSSRSTRLFVGMRCGWLGIF
jgi:predicted nucleic acid-binding protein